MMRKQRGRVESANAASKAAAEGPCAVCGLLDMRALVAVALSGGEQISLCGSHELMHRREASPAATLAELKTMFADRRGTDRRGGKGEVDELADALSAAFLRDRRASSRRAS